MSIGYCGRIELFAEDDNTALYRYCGENWNDDSNTRGSWEDMDGEILIQKKCLVEPEIHTKLKKMPSGRKKLVSKRIVQPFDISAAIRSGDIQILKPCTSEYSQGLHIGIDRMYFAYTLLRKLFTEYQEQGKLPEKCSFIV